MCWRSSLGLKASTCCSSHVWQKFQNRRIDWRQLEFSFCDVAPPAGEVLPALHLRRRRGVGMLLPLLLHLCLPGPAPTPASSLAILSQPTNITRESGQVRLTWWVFCQCDDGKMFYIDFVLQAVSFPCKVKGLSSGQQTIWRSYMIMFFIVNLFNCLSF